MSLSYVVTKLWCLDIFFSIGKVRGRLLLEGRLLIETLQQLLITCLTSHKTLQSSVQFQFQLPMCIHIPATLIQTPLTPLLVLVLSTSLCLTEAQQFVNMLAKPWCRLCQTNAFVALLTILLVYWYVEHGKELAW